MNEEPKIPVQAVIDQLMERIAYLELEVAVLKATLGQITPIPPIQEEPHDETGQYL